MALIHFSDRGIPSTSTGQPGMFLACVANAEASGDRGSRLREQETCTADDFGPLGYLHHLLRPLQLHPLPVCPGANAGACKLCCGAIRSYIVPHHLVPGEPQLLPRPCGLLLHLRELSEKFDHGRQRVLLPAWEYAPERWHPRHRKYPAEGHTCSREERKRVQDVWESVLRWGEKQKKKEENRVIPREAQDLAKKKKKNPTELSSARCL